MTGSYYCHYFATKLFFTTFPAKSGVLNKVVAKSR